MEIKLNFFGAAQNVTGSCYLLEANGTRLLIDCGFFQERKFKKLNWEPFPFGASNVDAVLLTHAHLDHCGRLPKLVKDGFKGKIHCTPATADIATIVMLDSAKIQMEDVAYKKRRHEREGRVGPFPYEPLYTVEDAERASGLFAHVPYDKPVTVGNNITATYRECGHILGSTAIEVRVTQGNETRSIVFSGDVGRWDTPIIKDPAEIQHADYVLCESTYGNRTHKSNVEIPDRLARMINETVEAGGNILIPSFSVERAQELLYHLNGLLNEKRIPKLPVFVDSPMAVRVTEVFRRHPELFDEETQALLRKGDHPCDFPSLTMCRSVDESKAINGVEEPCIIIAGSGMCTGGRIKHHLIHNVGREESTLLFVGYQAVGTLGRRLLERESPVRIFGVEREVCCRVAKVNGFSAHADRNELLRWMSSLQEAPRKVIVTHGEEQATVEFADFIRSEKDWNVDIAHYDEPMILN